MRHIGPFLTEEEALGAAADAWPAWSLESRGDGWWAVEEDFSSTASILGRKGGRPRKAHVPDPSASGLRGPALCGRPASYGTGDHTLIRAQAREGGDHWCRECLALI